MLYNLFTYRTSSPLISLEWRLDGSHGDMPLPDYISLSPVVIVEQAESNLVTLSHMMYRAHGSEGWYIPLMAIRTHLVHTILPQIRWQRQRQLQPAPAQVSPLLTEALRATVIMCVKGLWDQGLNTYVAETMFHLAYELLDEDDAATVSRSIGLRYQVKDHVNLMQQHSQATTPIGAYNVGQEARGQRIERLIDRFGGMRVNDHARPS